MAVVTKETYEEWRTSEVTLKLFHALKAEREELKEGLVYANYDNPDEVRGMCKAIANFLDLQYEDLFPNVNPKPES